MELKPLAKSAGREPAWLPPRDVEPMVAQMASLMVRLEEQAVIQAYVDYFP
jgi:H2-forming N5,N10-methylenetetrahydromethanopterin dehydrogenase-like enzyme